MPTPPQILKGPKPGTPHVINVHGFTLNKIYQKQKQKQKQKQNLPHRKEEFWSKVQIQ